MPLAIAQNAHFQLAASTFTILSAVFLMNISWLDPLTAATAWTIYPILSCIFLILPVPVLLKIDIKQALNMFQRYMVCSTAFRWHMLRISNGKLKYSP